MVAIVQQKGIFNKNSKKISQKPINFIKNSIWPQPHKPYQKMHQKLAKFPKSLKKTTNGLGHTNFTKMLEGQLQKKKNNKK